MTDSIKISLLMISKLGKNNIKEKWKDLIKEGRIINKEISQLGNNNFQKIIKKTSIPITDIKEK